jgi:glycosyltransferase involved in cell wall biosynthesis
MIRADNRKPLLKKTHCLMKLIILHSILPAYRKDFFETLSKQLKEKDIEMTVMHGTSTFKQINSDTNPGYNAIPMPTKEINPFGFRVVWWKGTFRQIRKIDPDMLIILFNPGNISFWLVQIYAYFNNIKVGLWSNGSVRKEITGVKKSVREFFLNFFLRRAKVHLCYGSRYKKELLAMGFRESEIFVAQNTINVEKIMASCEGKKRDASDDKINFLSVGVLIRDKNIDLAIKAISRLIREGYKASFTVIGKGKILEELRALVVEEKMEEHIYLLGYKSDEEIPEYFMNADVFMMPGVGGLAVNEAMAYGLPILSTVADGTILDLLEEGRNGYYFDQYPSLENVYDVCRKTLGKSKAELIEMGEQSRQMVKERATLQNMVDGFEKAIIYTRELK